MNQKFCIKCSKPTPNYAYKYFCIDCINENEKVEGKCKECGYKFKADDLD